jgi:hypothetical protein
MASLQETFGGCAGVPLEAIEFKVKAKINERTYYKRDLEDIPLEWNFTCKKNNINSQCLFRYRNICSS